MSSENEYEKGSLMVINLDLGKLGVKVLNCFSNENPDTVATTFCKINKLGPKTKETVAKLVKEKQEKF